MLETNKQTNMFVTNMFLNSNPHADNLPDSVVVKLVKIDQVL